MTGLVVDKPSSLLVHVWILPRWFAWPGAVCPVLLGFFLTDAELSFPLLLALGAATAFSASLHCWNSVVDWISGVDKPGGSVEKPYTSGSQVLPRGWAPLWAVIANAGVFFAAALGLVGWLSLLTDSWWPWFGAGLAIVFGGLYSPIWKYHYAPELCGLLGFGVGGVAIGMSAAGSMDVARAFLVGLAISLPFAVSWGVDQLYDAETDVQRGVRNIGGLLHVSGFPAWAYSGLGVGFTYVYLVFLITIGALTPWAGLSFLIVPFWVVMTALLYSKPAQGVKWGLISIGLYMTALVIAEVIA